MQIIDTHTHIYSKEFDSDRMKIVQSAKKAGVKAVFLPNEDSLSINALLKTCDEFPDFAFPMMGLHPTSVNENYIAELQIIEKALLKRKFYAIGEIGIDLYWDKTFFKEQQIVFEEQLKWSIDWDMPVVIHTRNSLKEALNCIYNVDSNRLKGIFHCFCGSLDDWHEISGLSEFYVGIGGVITFKNSNLSSVLPNIPLKRIVLETDAPYLAPVPFRGKRNEPAYIVEILKKVAECYKITPEDVADVTKENANRLFKV
jgi:TatD DNase family protein